jgi:predicted dehydrogenase
MFRRQFIKQTGITALGLGVVAAVPMDVLAAIRKTISPNDKIGVGLIGCKGMGWANLTSMLKISEVQCVALCDIDDTVLEQRKADLSKINQSPAIYKDYRKLLEQKEVDVVIIATPDHWHCLMMTDACAAGKQMLVEKPVSNSIGEAEIMVKHARQYKSIVQVNQWQRSQQHFKDAIAFVQSGKLGTIAQTKAWMYNGHQILPPAIDGPVPAGVDYNMWLGPAPKRTFNANRFHYNFRWYWDYAGGLMTDWGVHLIDMVILGMKADLPVNVTSMGGHIAFPGDARETPDTQTALYSYKDFQLTWEHTMGRQYGAYGMSHGIAFIGEKGTLLLNRDGWEVRPEKDKDVPRMEVVSMQKRVDNGLDLHTANLIAAIKAGNAGLLNCPIEAAANTAIHCHMGNVAYRFGSTLHTHASPTGITFLEKGANKLIMPDYQNGWKLPV